MYQSQKGFRKRYISIVIGVPLILASIFTGTFLAVLPKPTCVAGSISFGGSSALLPLVSDASEKYRSMCPQSTITNKGDINTSQAGLLNLRIGKNIDIADSDLRSNNLSLVDHPVAIVTYVVVLNQSVTGVPTLTTKQIQGIYLGKITNWNQIGGPDLPIVVVSRTTTSGTRETFEQYVLHGPEKLPRNSPRHYEVDTTDEMATLVAAMPGAIGYLDVGTATRNNLQIVPIDSIEALPDEVKSNTYKFWTVEHMYTKSNPSNLTTAFINYIGSDQFKSDISNLSYMPVNIVPANVLSEHPSPLAPDSL